MKPIKKVKIMYWIALIFSGWIIFSIMEGSDLMKLTAFVVVIILVEMISRGEMRQAIKEEKEELEEKRLKGIKD